jgi:hypothetical protein
MGEVLDAGYYDYDFIKKEPTKLPEVEDLQSSLTSLLIADGMTLWGPQEDNWALVSTEREAQLAESEMEWTGMDVASIDNTSGADEQAVEKLLTEEAYSLSTASQ